MNIKKAMDTTIARTTYCYSYHRISTLKQKKGGGIKRQIEDSEAFCNEQGWTMDTSFKLTDIGKSAFHGKNLDDKAALGSFLNAVDNGLIRRPAILLVESLDRLSRANIMDALELFIRILNTEISICTYHDRMIYSKESIEANFGPLLISITILSRAHEESATKSKRLKKSWKDRREKIANGIIAHKRIYPDWIDVNTDSPIIIEKRADMIREVFDLCINHNMSYGLIIKSMREKYGEEFTVSTRYLNNLFTQKRVLGLYEPKELASDKYRSLHIEIPAYPAIIDEDTFYAAKAAIKSRATIKSGRPAKRETNFFRSLLFCGECGYAMGVNGSNRYSSYKCKTRLTYRTECSQSSVIATNDFQTVLLKAIAVIDKDDMLVSASNSKKTKLSKELSAKQTELEDKQGQVDNLAKLVAAGSETGVRMIVGLEKDIGFINQQIVEIQEQLTMLASPNMAASIDHINAFHKRFQLGKATREDQMPFVEALKNTIEKIVIHSPEKEGQRTIAVIHLLSGIKIKIEVFKDYSANVFKGKKRILKIEGKRK